MVRTHLLLLPIALLQLAAAYIPTALEYPSIGEQATANGIPPELPLGIFFAIWGVIFVAYIGFGIHAARQNTELAKRLSGPLLACGVITALWMPIQQILGQPVIDLILLLPLLWFSWLAALRFDEMRGLGGSPIKWTTDVLTGLLSGWAVVATAISVPRAARHVLNQGPTDAEWIAFWSVLGVISIATYVYKRWISRTVWYYWAAAWGLLGILLNNAIRTDFKYFAWITLFFGAWLIFRRITRGANGARRPRVQA